MPKISRVRPLGSPASVKVRRAARSSVGSASSAVSTPSARMPCSSHSPATPPPPPMVTTERAPTPAASTASTAPTAGSTGGTVPSASTAAVARCRAWASAGDSAAKVSAYAAASGSARPGAAVRRRWSPGEGSGPGRRRAHREPPWTRREHGVPARPLVRVCA
ncbi:hypothetical protein ACFQX8_28795 [Klenkia terrae]|uniref:hypothetical protein n=1 Tax=Klenkia terrae TaxID=1052259 RepID=UPI00360FC4C5